MTIKELLKIIALAAASFCLVSLGALFLQVRLTVREMPSLLKTELTGSREQVLKTTTDLYQLLSRDIRLGLKTTDSRIASIQADANTQLTMLNGIVDKQLTATNASVSNLAGAYSILPAAIGARVDPYTDCLKNSLCWQNQVSDNLFASRTAMRDVSGAMSTINGAVPKIAADIAVGSGAFASGFPHIVKNLDSITGNISQITKPHWYDRVFGYGLNGALLYRTLNPVTNVTFRAAQVVSSQK